MSDPSASGWTCPKCGSPLPAMDPHAFSCVMRCKTCDCSVGMSVLSPRGSIVYDPSQEPKDEPTEG